MTEYDLVIFDCDGVLLDSEIISCRADAEAYTRLGYPISTEEMAIRFAGVSSEAIDQELSRDLGISLPADFRAKIKSEVASKYKTELCAIDGAEALLSSLSIQKCVASSASPAKLARGLLEAQLFELVYPFIFSTKLVANAKPSPDIFLYAAAEMQVAPSRCIVVEDSVAGVRAAKSAGMTCIGFTGGSHCHPGHAHRLYDVGADHVVDHLDAVNALLNAELTDTPGTG